MKTKKKQNSHKTQKQQSQARLEQEFSAGISISREYLEQYGFDTTNVDDATMRNVASTIGEALWVKDVVFDVAETHGIPKLPE